MVLGLLPAAALAEDLPVPDEVVVETTASPSSPAVEVEEVAAEEPAAPTTPADVPGPDDGVAAAGLEEDDLMELDAAEPTLIVDQAGLAAMDGTGSYKLGGDIDLTGKSWTSINFAGTLDGDGHTITLDGAPLFNAITTTGTVKNLLIAGHAEGEQVGTLAITNQGMIRNCYSSASVKQTDWNNVGGLVYQQTAGSITNCVVTGELSDNNYAAQFAIAAKASAGSSITYCYWVDKEGTYKSAFSGAGAEGTATGKETCEEKTEDDIKDVGFLTDLNASRGDGDLLWGLNSAGTYPIPGGEGAGSAVDKSTLDAKISDAEKMSQSGDHGKYTDSSWSALETALAAAKDVSGSDTATQSEVTAALETLSAAVEGLKLELSEAMNKLVERPAAVLPRAADAVVINDVDGLLNMDSEKTYYLNADITISGGDLELDTLLDGNGHTITLGSATYPLFKSIGSNGRVQNLALAGKVTGVLGKCPLATTCAGIVVNCYSRADVDTESLSYATGLVGVLKSGGAIVNSYTAGEIKVQIGVPPDSSDKTERPLADVSALAATAESNTLILNSFWPKANGDVVWQDGGRLIGSAAKTPAEFYTRDNVLASLNEHRGEGQAWAQCSDGYPWFGEEQPFTPPRGQPFYAYPAQRGRHQDCRAGRFHVPGAPGRQQQRIRRPSLLQRRRPGYVPARQRLRRLRHQPGRLDHPGHRHGRGGRVPFQGAGPLHHPSVCGLRRGCEDRRPDRRHELGGGGDLHPPCTPK